MNNKSVVKYKLWEMIADEISRLGAPTPHPDRKEAGVKCRKRWNHLCYYYRKFKEVMDKSGGKRSPPKYFNEVEAVLSAQQRMNSLSEEDMVDISALAAAQSGKSESEDMTGRL